MDSSFYYYSLYDLAWYLVPFVIVIYILNSSWLKKVIGDKQANRVNRIKTPLVVVLVCCAAYLFLRDDELNPEIVALLEEYSSKISKKASMFMRKASPVKEIMNFADPEYIRKLGVNPNNLISFAGGWVNHNAPENLRKAYVDITSDP